MNLPSLVHGNRHSPETQQSYNQVIGGSYQRQDMAASFVHSTYPLSPSTYQYSHTPQPPPSPPVEEASKCSLPSISSLLVYADGGSSNTSENSEIPLIWASENAETDGAIAPERQHIEPVQDQHTPDMRHGQQHSIPYCQTTINSSRVVLPPTPPMRPDSEFEGAQSPSTASQHSVSTPGHYFSSTAMSSIENPQSRQTFAPIPQKRHSMSLVTSLSYSTSPIQSLNGPYYQTPSQPLSHAADLYYQRPLPQNFPPSVVPVSVTPSTTSNPWQHHHYISPSSQAAFPQSQDRYICQTCSKAFSRPSSLRIHSHSHTGEKPFKCPHHGCGKAFSVRSNMKRHERGCHSSSASSL